MTHTNGSTTRTTDLTNEQPDEGRGVLIDKETASVLIDVRHLKAEVRLVTSAESPTARSIPLLAVGVIAVLAMTAVGSVLASAGASAPIIATTAGGLFVFSFAAGLYAVFRTPRRRRLLRRRRPRA
ncbi:hypothetical protein ACFXAW_35790 [Streptomyces sp. NPDC059445]|uniref:hypothetical protein n=1 Tax=unclassified Streptomyces TaxID=2593676 RepID=UPI0036B8E00B